MQIIYGLKSGHVYINNNFILICNIFSFRFVAHLIYFTHMVI